MTAYYVDSAGGNSDGLTWAKAFTSFAAAVTAATGDGDVIYIDQGFTDTVSADTTYTFANNVNVICSNDKTNTPPQTLGNMGTSNWIGHHTASYSISLTGAYKVYLCGVTFRVAGSSAKSINCASADGSHFVFVSCYLWGNTSSSGFVFGSSSSGINNYIELRDTTLRFGSTSAGMTVNSAMDCVNCTLSSDGSAPTTLVKASSTGCAVSFTGCDLSVVTGALIASQSSRSISFQFSNCKLGSGVVVLATQTPGNKSSGTAMVYNCSSGDEHYHIAHYDSFGSTIVDTGIYANDGAKYDGTNGCSWKIVTSSACSYYTPYVSPWIDVYHSGTSAITPSLEIVRSGSATAYQDDEVWAEFSYQGTSGYPLATVVSDRKGLLASAADQTTGALGAGDWTGENATSWFGKLNPTAAITPAEIGHLRARVCVGEPSVTVYVDPTIRGRS